MGQQDGPIESMGGNKEDAGMDTLVAEAGSSDYLVNIVHDHSKIVELLNEGIRALHYNRSTLLQQNRAIRLVFLMHIIDQFILYRLLFLTLLINF